MAKHLGVRIVNTFVLSQSVDSLLNIVQYTSIVTRIIMVRRWRRSLLLLMPLLPLFDAHTADCCCVSHSHYLYSAVHVVRLLLVIVDAAVASAAAAAVVAVIRMIIKSASI